ncbi:MAG: nitrogen regulation protein NR(II) [Vicinamibacterales bacterium]
MPGVLPAPASTIIRLDEAGRVATWPDSASAMFARLRGQVVGHPLCDLLDERQHSACANVIQYLAGEPHGVVHTLAVTATRPGGATFAAECSIWRVPPPSPRESAMFDVLVRDLTERDRTEHELRREIRELGRVSTAQAQALQEARSLITDLTETIDEVFWIADASITRMLYISPAYERVWGRSCASLYENPKSFIDAIHPADRARVVDDLVVQRDGLPFDHEYRIERPDGSVAWVWDRGYPVRNAYGQVTRYIGVAQDITLRKVSEAAARRQDTLDAIGHMTGGLAHDFNNVLGVIVGHLDLAALAVGPESPASDSLAQALDAAMRGERLARRLLALARQQPAERRELCLAASIEELRPLLAYVVGPASQVDVEVAARPAVNVDPGELDAALINLAVDARAAMRDGGRLTITVDDVRLGPRKAAEFSLPAGRYASLLVSDTGVGMTPEVLERVGEPFFTTRPGQEGTGLGVSMVHAFVRQSGGAMRVDSTPGVGTRFRLLLPAA